MSAGWFAIFRLILKPNLPFLFFSLWGNEKLDNFYRSLSHFLPSRVSFLFFFPYHKKRQSSIHTHTLRMSPSYVSLSVSLSVCVFLMLFFLLAAGRGFLSFFCLFLLCSASCSYREILPHLLLCPPESPIDFSTTTDTNVTSKTFLPRHPCSWFSTP